ncbi:hypothetical protein SAMN04487967_1743 [Natronorubrum sediminis]|uniref:Uncharacterized protein n=1 Tax=Natronorubrum sediminis TaxID=640943 RepID=A0A1H6FVD5_9EURY|nr:hypothetical protein [Natronorubrum sediminis]SEH14737.1 hypothetical protein SAMN04487967_1743 [Natronorubrum sediminis]
MSGDSKESTQGIKQNQSPETDGTSSVTDTPETQPLSITLPDGSENVADAIVTHREMLTDPHEHGLATDEDISHLSKAMETFSDRLEKTTQQYDETQSQVDELHNLVEHQQQQINELQSVVISLADILGTEAEWTKFNDT